MYIFGGHDSKGIPDNKFYRLNLNNLIWTKLNDQFTPGKRWMHCLIPVHDNLYLVGGAGMNY